MDPLRFQLQQSLIHEQQKRNINENPFTVEKPPRLRRIVTMTVSVEIYGDTEPQFSIVDEVHSILERELRAGKVVSVEFRGEISGYE